jgi:hypothetical protein
VLHLGCCEPFRHLQGRAEGEVQGHGLLGTLGRFWQRGEQCNAGGKVADGLQIGRVRAGVFSCSLPVGHRLLGEARFGVVVGQQCGLWRDSIGKLRL